MSSTQQRDEDSVRETISMFLKRNFPQIQMHGGDHAINSIDLDEASVTLTLGGACDGCGLSPMTLQAIQTRLTNEIPEIDTVHASTGGMGPTTSTSSRPPERSSDGGFNPDTPF